MTTEKKQIVADDDPLTPVPLDKRQHWLTPAMIFGGLEFCVPILMVGATLAASFSLAATIPIILFAFIVIQWAGNTINGFIGAKTGRASSVIARCGFGAVQARIIIALVIFMACMGWWSLQTSVAGNSICAMLGIDYNLPEKRGLWMLITIIAGVIFAAPSVIGYSSMKWTDYISVPAGLLLCAFGIYLGVSNGGGLAKMFANAPETSTIGVIAAVNIILGMNISQWIIAADYTRYAKPKLLDNILIPLGIIAIGIPLMFVGAIMSVGQGTADIVEVMVKLGFPFWGFIVLWLSTWTSQLVNNYTMGLSFSNLLNVSSNRGRMLLTLAGTFIALVAAISGILNYFTDFLYLTSLAYAPIAGVIFSDFFMRRGEWEDHGGWNWVATIALACGVAVGYVTTYVSPAGIPILQSIALTALVYVVGMKVKAGVAPDAFTPGRFLRDGK